MICIDSLKNYYFTPIEIKFIDLFVGAKLWYAAINADLYIKNRCTVYILENNVISFRNEYLYILFNNFNEKLDINTLQKLTKKHINNNLIVKQ